MPKLDKYTESLYKWSKDQCKSTTKYPDTDINSFIGWFLFKKNKLLET